MKGYIKILILLSAVFIIQGCSPSTTVTKIYLQEVQVYGPINQTPLHVTDSSNHSITVSPKFAYNPYSKFKANVEGHSNVNEKGFFQLDTIFTEGNHFYLRETPNVNRFPFTQKNMTWHMPEVAASLDIDMPVSKSSSFFIGVNYSSAANDRIYGGQAGIGFFSVSSNAAIRIDIGLALQELVYKATTLMTVETTTNSGSSGHAVIFEDRAKSSNVNPFLSFTWNTRNYNWPMNIFLNGGFNIQTVLNFEPNTKVERNPFYYEDVNITEDTRQKTTISFLYLTPGLYLNTGSGRILFGTRLLYIAELNTSDRNFFVFPVVQFDFPF